MRRIARNAQTGQVVDECWDRTEYRRMVDGVIVEQRPMTEAEVAEWHARNPPPPLVPDADRIDDDHTQAALMLLAEDAALAVVLLERLAAAGGLDVEAARAEARAAMATLSADPALRDDLIRARLQ